MPTFKYINITADTILVSKNKVTPSIQTVSLRDRTNKHVDGMTR